MVEEAVAVEDLGVLEAKALLAENGTSSPGDPDHPHQQPETSAHERPEDMRPLIAVDLQVSHKTQVAIDSAAAG